MQEAVPPTVELANSKRSAPTISPEDKKARIPRRDTGFVKCVLSDWLNLLQELQLALPQKLLRLARLDLRCPRCRRQMEA